MHFFKKTGAFLKAHFRPLSLSLFLCLLNLFLAALGPYFHRPHWSAAVFPPLILTFLTFASFYLGGVWGALALYLFCSFCFLELFLGVITGGLSDDLLSAMASSGGFHHFQIQAFFWCGAGLVFIFFSRHFFKRDLRTSGYFAIGGAVLFLLNLPLSYHQTDDLHLHVQFTPFPVIGSKNNGTAFQPLLTTPTLLSACAYELRHAMPGALGDLLALAAFAEDPGADMLQQTPHPLPKNLSPQPEEAVQNIVMIIGEASTPLHYHAYHYPLETTPELDLLLSEGKACKISKAHAAANQTRNAILPSISLWTLKDPQLFLSQMNLIELAKQEGYRTYWASTQSEHGEYSGQIGYIGKYADYFVDSNTGQISFQGQTLKISENDEDLLPFLEHFSSQEDPSAKKLIILHLWGSHLPYGEKITEADSKALPFASAYDQSIHRTDRLLGEIVRISEKNLHQPLVLYFSDHGEDPSNPAGHGIGYGGKDYDIPLILIGKQAQKTCRYIETLRAENGWYSSNMNKFFLLRLLGMKPDQNWIKHVENPDLVLMPNGKIHPWGKIPKQHLS